LIGFFLRDRGFDGMGWKMTEKKKRLVGVDKRTRRALPTGRSSMFMRSSKLWRCEEEKGYRRWLMTLCSISLSNACALGRRRLRPGSVECNSLLVED
jgi:hypothetical protein